MRDIIMLAGIILAFFVNSSYSQQITNESAVFVYEDGRKITHDLDLRSLLSMNRIQLKNGSVPDTVGLQSIMVDSSYYAIAFQSGNSQRPHVIVKRIIDGKIELFTTPDPSALNQIFARKDGIFRELRSYKRYVNQSEFVQVKEYISVLRFLFLDCARITSVEIEKAHLNQKSLTPLINRYNMFFGSEREVALAGEKERRFFPSIEFSFLAGYSVRNIRIKHIHASYPSSSMMKTDGPSFGISVLLKPSRSSKLDFALDLMWGKIQETSSAIHWLDNSTIEKSEITYDFIHARHNALVRYDISPTDAVKIRVGIGGSMHWRGSDHSAATTRWIYNSDEYRTRTVPINNRGSSGYMPMASIAVAYKVFDVRYNYATNTLHYRHWEEKSVEHRVILGVNLSKVLRKK